MRNKPIYYIAALVTMVVGMVYWPVIHGDFVWDDWPGFHDQPWLTQGDLWKHYIFRDFNSWTFYFRPLGVAFFTLQVRLFEGAPGPMHAVSLALHLINTLLVGLLSWRCGMAVSGDLKRRTWATAGCMLIYGLHPVLIEPVAWIGCQFDLILTMLVLFGLLANAYIRNEVTRALAVTALFFLAACTKESALSLPLLVIIFDWALFAKRRDERVLATLRVIVHRNWMSYLGMLLAGFAYLAFRHWALGQIENPFKGNSATLFSRLHEISFIYLNYWRMMFWPISAMGPIHPFDARQFEWVSLQSLAIIFVALGVVLMGLYLAIRLRSPLGCIVLAATAALLPMLHIIPQHFELSLYHERYAIVPLAIICSMLPLLRMPRLPASDASRQRLAIPLLIITGVFWLIFSIIDIHVILPMWSNDTNLWQWALATNPHATQAKSNLLRAYEKNKDYVELHKLGDRILADSAPCAFCMLSIAGLAVDEHDPARAEIALNKARASPLLLMDKSMLHSYYLTTGRMLILQGKPDDAEQVLDAAVSLAPHDAQSKDALAEALALKGEQEQTH